MPDDEPKDVTEYNPADHESPLYNKAGPIPASTKAIIKARLLEVLGRTDTVMTACAEAGITRKTYMAWVREGYITKEDLEEASLNYEDQIRGTINQRGFVGSKKPLLSSGRLVTDKKGEPIYVNVPDNNLLLAIAKYRLPEYKQEQHIIIEQTVSGIPAQFEIVLDYRWLTEEQRITVYQIVKDVAERQEQAKDDPSITIEGSIISSNGNKLAQ